ncbi:MAG TPA: ABC transporter permease [Gemmatimonadaceae bacterium]|nr:ABC transporter permease [Gemmatimonadaceae bacterium]
MLGLTGLVARMRSLWRALRRRTDVEREMAEEFRLHQELRAADLVRAGLSPAEATRRARLEFGSTERYKHEGRASRGLRPFDALGVSWLDVKLGFRMLVKYPGLTIVGGLAMAFAIWVGAGTFEFVGQVLYPTLPLPGGDRIVGIQVWDAAEGRAQRQVAHDFVQWRAELRSVQELGAFRTLERNLITGEGRGEPVEVAEISASAFRLTRVPPLLGRALVAADEQPGAPPVAVLGYEVWQRRFAGDSTIVGRTVRLGRTPTTVVGVMPDGYAFPIAQRLWTPLHLDVLDYDWGEGPSIRVFGRLAPGVSLEEAQAELSGIGARTAAAFPRTHEHLRPRVLPYTESILSFSGTESMLIGSSNVFLLMLLVLVCGNVALLMFARAATRESELAVRTALGASRARIVGQLFAEALVLAGAAAAVGLVGVGSGIRWGMRVVEAEMFGGSPLPFWFHASLSPTTVLYVALLTLFGAVIAGVVPALKVTRGLQARLRESGAGGGGLKFGGIWTAVIVSQVAVTVAFPVTAFAVRHDVVQIRTMKTEFAAEHYLSARLEMDREPPPGAPGDTSQAAFLARFGGVARELEERLSDDPAVAGVTFADRLPRMYHPHRLIELDEGGGAPLHPQWPAGYRVSDASVDLDYFDVLGAPIRAGRGFHSGDLAADAHTVIVNQSFVDKVLGGRNPIGRHLRYVYFEGDEAPLPPGERGPWYEIVGVVPDLGMAPQGYDPKYAGLYHPAAPGAVYPVHMAIQVRGDPAALAPTLRTVAAAVDPTLRLNAVVPMVDLSQSELQFLDFWFRLTMLVSVIAVVLSLAGIYAVMSFTVARRTREIGIRVALGADRRRVLLAIFRRPLVQVSAGIAAGAALIASLILTASGGAVSLRGVGMLVGYALVMLAVCLLACIVPTRRALRVEPTEALRVE